MTNRNRLGAWLLSLFLFSSPSVFAACKEAPAESCGEIVGPKGWSVDLGGQYTWISFTTPPTYSGSTGGIIGKLTYQTPWAFFGQLRTVYNLGPLSSSLNSTRFYEWYLEVVGGYCFPIYQHWSFTPYVGVGFDYIHDNHSPYDLISGIQLRYRTYYAIAGFDTHYAWKDWTVGVQFDCLPIFNQYLKVEGLPEAAWILGDRVGFDARLPLAYRIPMPCCKRTVKDVWVELAPYYRYLPVGPSNALGLPHRSLNQWGFFLTFRFYL